MSGRFQTRTEHSGRDHQIYDPYPETIALMLGKHFFGYGMIAHMIENRRKDHVSLPDPVRT